jgi:hypothetical protein
MRFVEPLVDRSDPLAARMLLAFVLALQVAIGAFLLVCVVGAAIELAA